MGADVREEARVNEVLTEEGRVVGVSFEHEGSTHEARARYVVDASGLSAVVANKLSFRQPAEELKNMALYGYWKGVHPAPVGLGGDIRPGDRNNIIIKMLDTGWLWFIPLGFDDLISVGYVTQRDNLPEARGRAALEEYFLDRVKSSEEFSYLLSNSEYSGEFHTVKDWSYRSAEMAGPGYFAVGDAACFVDPILSSGVYLAVLYAKLCATGVNTCLTDPGRESIVQEWYEGLYADTYTDYLAMARLWYHGDRKVQKWMHQAQDQLSSEAASEYTETDRSSFLGLATGNAHTHPNYVLLRDLSSYPLPLLLRKDPRLGFHKEAHTALMANADPSMLDAGLAQQQKGAKTAMASSPKMRAEMASLLAAVKPLTEKLAPGTDRRVSSEDEIVAMDPKARLSLEVVDDKVEMLVTTRDGQRRLLSHPEQVLLSRLSERPSLQQLRESALDGGGASEFLDELLSAGVLTPV
jgi:flavin-dependent dehydrogenase